MAKIGTVTFVGESGTSYTFDVYTADTEFNDVSAVYIFTKRTLSGEIWRHARLYIGEAERMGERIKNHEKWPCVNRHGCNCICVLLVSSSDRRLDIETDLRRGNDTPCNDQ